MTTVVAGRFRRQEEAQQAVSDLMGWTGCRSGCDRDGRLRWRLYGALGTTDDKNNPETLSARDENRQRKLPRMSGMLAAALAPSPAEQDSAIRILRARAVTDIKRAECTIIEGNWIDFNRLRPLTLVPL